MGGGGKASRRRPRAGRRPRLPRPGGRRPRSQGLARRSRQHEAARRLRRRRAGRGQRRPRQRRRRRHRRPCRAGFARSIWSRPRSRRLAGRAAAAVPTWPRAAARTAPRRTRRLQAVRDATGEGRGLSLGPGIPDPAPPQARLVVQLARFHDLRSRSSLRFSWIRRSPGPSRRRDRPAPLRTAAASLQRFGHRVGDAGPVERGGMGGVAGAGDDRQVGVLGAQALGDAGGQHRIVHRQDHRVGLAEVPASRSARVARHRRTSRHSRRFSRP